MDLSLQMLLFLALLLLVSQALLGLMVLSVVVDAQETQPAVQGESGAAPGSMRGHGTHLAILKKANQEINV